MRPATTFILSSVDSHALAGFPKELKPCIDEALQDPKILRKILTNDKITSNPQFGRMMVGKMAKEHPVLTVDAMTQPHVIEALEDVNPQLARKIEIADDKFAADERIEAIYDNASANLLKLAARQDPQAMLDFAMDEHVLPMLMMEDASLPGDLADIFEEEFGGLGTLGDEDELLIRDLREISSMTLAAGMMEEDTLSIISRIRGAARKVVKTVRRVATKVRKTARRVVSGARNVARRVGSSVRNVGRRVTSAARNATNRVRTRARNAARAVRDRVASVRNAAVKRAKQAAAAVATKVKQAKAAAVKAAGAARDRMVKVRDAAVQKAKDARAAALSRMANIKKAAADRAKKVKDMFAAKAKKAQETLAAARKRVADAGQKIKDAKNAAINATKKLWGGIKGGVNKSVQAAKNVVGGAAKKYNNLKAAAKQKLSDYKKKYNDLKAAAKAKIDAKILKTKEYIAKKAKASWEAAKSAKDWSKQKLASGLKLAGKTMKAGGALLKKGKDIVVGAGKGALNLGLGAVKAVGGGLLKAGTAALMPFVKAGRATTGFIIDTLAARAAAQEDQEEEPQEEELPPQDMYDEGGMYDDMGGQMSALPAEEEYPEEEMYPDEELPPGAECRDGEEMAEEQMVCVGGQWVCKEGAEMEIEPGMSMKCVNGEWASPDMDYVPEGGEAGLPEGHVCKVGDREEITTGVYMACVNGQWEMPQMPGDEELPPGAECREGDEMPIDDMHSMRCCDGKWKSVTKGTWGEAPVPDEGELPPGAVCIEGETVTQGGVSMTCVGGQWQTPELPPIDVGMPDVEEDMPPYDEGVPPEYLPHDPSGDGSSAAEGGYIAPELEDIEGLPDDIKQEIADEIQDVTTPEAEEWSEEGPVPGTVVPMPETGLPQIPVPIWGINVAKMVGWTGRTLEFQEIIPGLRPTPIPWVIPPIAEIPVIGPMLSSIEKIPLLPGFIVRDETGKVENTGMRIPTIPRNMVGLPAIPIPEPLAKPDFGYDPETVVAMPDVIEPVVMPDGGAEGIEGIEEAVTWDDSYAEEPGWDDAYGEPTEAKLGFRDRGYPLGFRDRGYPL